jgi:hypothetical protein
VSARWVAVTASDKPDPSIQALNEQADRAILAHMHSRNMLMLEAVISAMLDVHDPEGVAAILRDQAGQLEQYG